MILGCLLIGIFSLVAPSDSFEAVYAHGTQLAREGNAKQALVEFEKAAKLSPRNAKVQNMLGVVLTQLGQLKEADAAYARALALDPGFVPARKNRAVNSFTQGNLDFAAKEFGELAQLEPRDFVPRLFLGLTSIEKRQFQDARRELVEADRLSPGNPRVLLPLVRVEFIIGDRRLALEYAQKLWKQPQLPSGERFQLGVLLSQFGAHTEAAEIFQELQKSQPDSNEVVFNLALAEYRSGQLEAALKTIEQYSHRVKLSGEMLNLQGWIYGRMRRLDEAIRSFKLAMEADPLNADHYLDLSNALQSSAHVEEAIQVVLKGMERRVDLDRLQVQLGLLYQKKGISKQAEECYLKAMERNPANRSAYLALALLMYQTDRRKDSLELLKKAISVLPQDAFLYYLYGGQLLEASETGLADQLKEALKALNKSLELNPLYANTHYLLGKLYLKKGDFATAESFFEEACAFNPRHREALWQLTLIARQQGKKERVAELTQRMQELEEKPEKKEESFQSVIQDSLRGPEGSETNKKK